MPKLKTIKAVSKRVRRTKTGKITVKKCGQDHFNARESGKTTRAKRGRRIISKTITRTINNSI